MKIKYINKNRIRENYGRWNVLFLQYIKRDWLKILIWILSLSLFASLLVPVFEEIAKDDGLVGMYETMQNPAMISMVGPSPVEKASEYTLGAMYAQEMLLFASLFAMIISILHVIRHSRKEEDLGIAEHIRSFHIGRKANSLALILEVILINLVLAFLISIIITGFRAESMDIEGALLFALSIGFAGIMGASIALLMAQIMPVSSATTGSSLAIIGILYIVRGTTDISNLKLSMLNPFAWTYLSHPFTKNNWLPIFLIIIFSSFLIIISFYLEGKRDMGAGFLLQKEGRSHAKKSLLSLPGLFFKLNKGIIISWLLAYLILAIAYGTIYKDVETFLHSNELMKQMFTYSGISIEESFTYTIMQVMLDLITILPIAILVKLFSEEKRARLDQLFATKVKRKQIYWTNIVLAIVSGLIGILLLALGLGTTAILAMEESSMKMLDFFKIGFSLLPTLLFFTALASLALAWAPNFIKYVYAYLLYSFFINYYGKILNRATWLEKTTPQSWLSKFPIEDFNFLIYGVLIIISVVLIFVGSFGYEKRDLV